MLVHQREPGELVVQGSGRASLARSAPHRREKKYQDTKEKGNAWLQSGWVILLYLIFYCLVGICAFAHVCACHVYACICTHMCLFIQSPKVDSRIMFACSPPCMPRQELSTEPRPRNRASPVSQLPLGIPISVFPGGRYRKPPGISRSPGDPNFSPHTQQSL